jgi:hypothetical protein
MGGSHDSIDADKGEAVAIPPRYWWLKRILVGVGVLLVVLGCMRWWWGVEAQRRFDALIASYVAAGEPVFPEDFNRPAIPDEENAIPLLEQAVELFTEPSDVRFQIAAVLDYPKLCVEFPDEVWKLIEPNQASLELVHEAAGRPSADFGVRYSSPALGIRAPRLWAHALLVRLIGVSSLYEHHQGNDAVALERLGDALRCGAHLREGSQTLLGYLMAQVADGVVVGVIETTGAKLAVSSDSMRRQSQRIIGPLLDDETRRRDWRRALHMERMWQLDAVRCLCDGTMAPSSTLRRSGVSLGVIDSAVRFRMEPIWRLDARDVMGAATAMADRGAQENWPGAIAIAYPDLPESTRLGRLCRPLSSFVRSAFRGNAHRSFRAIANQRMGATALAIRLYEIDHGWRPDSLEELVPEYLPAVPEDPFFDDGRPIGYETAPPMRLYAIETPADPSDVTQPQATRIWFYLDGNPDRTNLPRALRRSPTSQGMEERRDEQRNLQDTASDQSNDNKP